jgi:hypothetical protein
MRRFFTAAGFLLAGTLAATAQTGDGCADIGVNPTPQLNDACGTTLGSSGGATGSAMNSADSGTSVPLAVPNDPLGQAGSIDTGTTSAIPGTPLVVPNDPLGTGNRSTLSTGSSSPGSRSGAIPSPSID